MVKTIWSRRVANLNRRESQKVEDRKLHVTYDSNIDVAADLALIWEGICLNQIECICSCEWWIFWTYILTYDFLVYFVRFIDSINLVDRPVISI